MIGNPIIITEIYECSIEKLWNALTNPEAMRDWYFDIKEFKLEKGFEFEFYADKYLHHCVIREVNLYNKLIYSWTYPMYEGYSEVIFEFNAISENFSQLTLLHEGFVSFPTEDPNFSRSSFEAGWNELLRISLKAYVEEE